MNNPIKQTAKLNYLRVAPRKVRLVADLLKGLSVNEAEAQLLYERKRPAGFLLKLLRSALAGAKEKKMNIDSLYIESIRVDQGPMLKRYLPRARGSASPIQKKMSHVTLVLAEKDMGKPPRFKIVVKKKVKLPPGEVPKDKKRVEPEEDIKKAASPKKPGFFKRMFSRKSGFAK